MPNPPKTPPYIIAFIEAVCPDAPALYAASFSEKTCLTDATDLIVSQRKRIAELEGTIRCMTETAAESSRVHVELHNRNTELSQALEALNEENSQLAHRLWCIENPE